MWITSSIFLAIVILIGLPFLLPFQLVAQSQKKNYCIRIPLYFCIKVLVDDNVVQIKGRLLFIPFTIRMDDLFKNEKDMIWPLREGYKFKRVALKVKDGWKTTKEVYHALTIHHIYANVDTGNFPLNAKIIPIASVLQKPNIAVQVNFVNHVKVDALIYTRLYKIMWIIIKNIRTKN